MKRLFVITSITTVFFIVVGMVRFITFRDFVYLLVILLAFIAIISGLAYIMKKLEK